MVRMTFRHAGVLLVSLLTLGVLSPAWAEQCAVCKENIVGEFVWLDHPAMPERRAVCQTCYKLETVCSVCRLPVKQDGVKLDDGRLLCSFHAQDAILAQPEADTVFVDTKREMMRLLRGCGTTPDRNITLTLVDGPHMLKLAEELHTEDGPEKTVGLTRSRREGTDWTHTVYVLSGQRRTRLLATAAHEYTHAWINENVPADRRLSHNTIEGFCELAAYRIMSDLNEEAEKRFILSNSYTRGQISMFVKLEDSHQFYRLVEWMKAGVEDHLDAGNADSVLALRKPEAALPVWPQAVPTKVPDTLQLKGVAGQPGHRLVLVNDLTLAVGEGGQARVGTSKIPIRCLAATESTAEIELTITGQHLWLTLTNR
jgi:hypothetical protein